MCQDGAPKRVTPKAMEFVGPAEEAALAEDAAPSEDKDATLPAPRLGPTAAPSVSESPPLLPDELAAVVDLPPWHALHLDGLDGITEPFREVEQAERQVAKQRSILAGCSSHVLLIKGDEKQPVVNGRPVSLGGSSTIKQNLETLQTTLASGWWSGVRTVTLGVQLLSFKGNPLAELRTAPLFGDGITHRIEALRDQCPHGRRRCLRTRRRW